MGYYVSLTESNFRIPKSKLDEAYERMCALNERDDLKGGGSSTGEKWFSWMDPNYPDTCPDAESILKALGFECEFYDFIGEEALWVISYDNKIGDEDKFLACICDIVPSDSYTEWRGEDGAMWKIQYGGPKPVEYSAKIEWEKV